MSAPPDARVAVTVTATANVAPQAAFAAIAPIDLTTIFTGLGPLPAVKGVRSQSGEWDHAGATRIVLLSDGSEVRERLTEVVPGERFGYVVGPFTGALGFVVEDAAGAWTFAPAAGGATAITWTYAFLPRRRRGALVRRLVAPAWRAYARRVLAHAVGAAESARDPRSAE